MPQTRSVPLGADAAAPAELARRRTVAGGRRWAGSGRMSTASRHARPSRRRRRPHRRRGALGAAAVTTALVLSIGGVAAPPAARAETLHLDTTGQTALSADVRVVGESWGTAFSTHCRYRDGGSGVGATGTGSRHQRSA